MDEESEDEVSLKKILIMVRDLTDIVDILHTEVSALKKLCAKEEEGEDPNIRVVRVDSNHFMHG